MQNPTKEQILKSAKTSPEAKKALQELFPDVFGRKISEKTKHSIYNSTFYYQEAFRELTGKETAVHFLAVRSDGNLAKQGFVIGVKSNVGEWEIVTDNVGFQVLVPKK